MTMTDSDRMRQPDDAELTRTLAEKVMGWTVYGYESHSDWVACVNHAHGADTCHIDRQGRVHIADDAAIAVRFWRPLHDMRDAWMVVERFIPKEGWSQQQYEESRRFWLYLEGTYSPLYAWKAGRAARIICLAAMASLQAAGAGGDTQL